MFCFLLTLFFSALHKDFSRLKHARSRKLFKKLFVCIEFSHLNYEVIWHCYLHALAICFQFTYTMTCISGQSVPFYVVRSGVTFTSGFCSFFCVQEVVYYIIEYYATDWISKYKCKIAEFLSFWLVISKI